MERERVGRRVRDLVADRVRVGGGDLDFVLIIVGSTVLLTEYFDTVAERVAVAVADRVAVAVAVAGLVIVAEAYVVTLGTKVSIGTRDILGTIVVVAKTVYEDDGLADDVCDGLGEPVADELEVDDIKELAVASRAAAIIVKIFILYV